MHDKNTVLISGAIIYKDVRGGKRYWFISKQSETGEWEFPKVVVRRTESSVRAVLRLMGEQAGMRTRVLEEAGRTSASATNNGKTVSQKFIYYLINHRADSGEIFGFSGYEWLEYAKAARKLSSKKEKTMLKQARVELKRWEKSESRFRSGEGDN